MEALQELKPQIKERVEESNEKFLKNLYSDSAKLNSDDLVYKNFRDSYEEYNNELNQIVESYAPKINIQDNVDLKKYAIGYIMSDYTLNVAKIKYEYFSEFLKG